MAKAEYIGIDKIYNLLSSNQVVKIDLKKNSRSVFVDQISENRTSDDIINNFINNFANIQPETNFATYTIHITNKRKADSISPDIAFYPPPGGEYVNMYKKTQPSTNSDLGFSTREFIEASTRMHILQDENARLREELEEISAENEELERKIPNGEQPQNIGTVLQSALYSNADKIIAILADKLFGGANNPSINLAGIPDQDVNSMLNQMMLIEPEFPSHLGMLINLRKNKPDIYSMAVAQLKSL